MRCVGRALVLLSLLMVVSFRVWGHANRGLDAVRPHARRSGAVKRPKARAVMGAPDLLSGAGPCSVLTAMRARAEPRINGGQRVALGRTRKQRNGSAETGRSGNSRGTPTARDGDGAA